MEIYDRSPVKCSDRPVSNIIPEKESRTLNTAITDIAAFAVSFPGRPPLQEPRMMVRREPYECLSTSERRALARNLGGNAEINPSLSEGRIFYF